MAGMELISKVGLKVVLVQAAYEGVKHVVKGVALSLANKVAGWLAKKLQCLLIDSICASTVNSVRR